MSLARLLFVSWLLALPSVSAAQPALTARVDPRVELLSIIFRLAGHPEYNHPPSRSPYANAVAVHFDAFRDHPVVQTAQRLKREYGVSYDAVMSMAVHIDDVPSLQPRIPFDLPPERLDSRWQPAEAAAFLRQASDFVRDTDFPAFLRAHQALYDQAAARLNAKLAERGYLAWFDQFFGARPGATFTLTAGLLNGGQCYGTSVRFPDGREEILPVLGVWHWDPQGVPVFKDDITGTVVHELCHAYTNPLVDQYAPQLERAGREIFSHCADQMHSQAYGTWQTMMYESLVRACVVRYLIDTDSIAAGMREIQAQHARGFVWAGELAQLLGDYDTHRTRYTSLADFMPRIVEFFQAYARPYAARQAQAPRVVAMTPANGAADVDPKLRHITITFDRPMTDGSWSVVGGGPHFPELAGPPQYDAERRVLTLPVRLKPEWSYEFWLNRGQYQGFRSADGVPLEPIEVRFLTRGGPLSAR